MINYKNISDAVSYYEQRGYKYVEVPWAVRKDVDSITRPYDRQGIGTIFGNLIGSGEQGYIQLMLDGKLTPGRYVCVTPCFRDDPIDNLHQKYFMKVELIDTSCPTLDGMMLMIAHATGLFLSYHFVDITVSYKYDPLCYGNRSADILCGNIELGSYGIRKHGDIKWAFGTGLAEPRTSIVGKLESGI